ncbi:uncharacterized protein TNCV_4453051 [Trichonephila clavipes]|nr:uncharacterized protein TNCV_4453051 [Trichonephila clavipes]
MKVFSHQKGSADGNIEAPSRRRCPENKERSGVLYRKWESDDGKTFRWQLILPKTRVSTVLKEHHGSPTGGHFGVMKTLQKVRVPFTKTNSFPPSQMIFRRYLRLPADILFSRPTDAPFAPEEYVEKLQARMEEMHHLSRERIGMASEKKKVAAVAEWYRYQTVACFVTGSNPVPLKTCRVGQRCTLNLSRAETSSRWCGVVVGRGGCQLRCRPRHLTMVQNYVVRRQKPSCS